MSDNVTPFKKIPEPIDPLIGPFSYHGVVVEGRLVPFMTGFYDGDSIALVVDGRFSISVPRDLAYQVAWLCAEAIAVASGYSHLGAENKDKPFAPTVSQIKGDEG